MPRCGGVPGSGCRSCGISLRDVVAGCRGVVRVPGVAGDSACGCVKTSRNWLRAGMERGGGPLTRAGAELAGVAWERAESAPVPSGEIRWPAPPAGRLAGALVRHPPGRGHQPHPKACRKPVVESTPSPGTGVPGPCAGPTWGLSTPTGLSLDAVRKSDRGTRSGTPDWKNQARTGENLPPRAPPPLPGAGGGDVGPTRG